MSHPNIIQDITNLENNLSNTNSRITTIENNIKTHAQKFSEYLPLSGGVMQGHIQEYQYSIPEGTNLNDLMTPGEYICSLTATAKTLLNCPYPNAFTMTIRNSSRLQQEWREYTGQRVYRRTYQNWGEMGWKQWIPDIVVVNSWVSGTQWFRIYTDGWIEQGGQATGGQYNYAGTVTFNTPFSNANYTCSAVSYLSSMGHWSEDVYIGTKTSSSMRIITAFNSQNGSSTQVIWYACGY